MQEINLEALMLQAYILVNKVRISYQDVKKMTRFERNMFLKFYSDELEQKNKMYEEQARKSR